MYVKLDNQTNELFFDLPDNFQDLIDQLKSVIIEKYSYVPINNEKIREINDFIDQWLESKYIIN